MDTASKHAASAHPPSAQAQHSGGPSASPPRALRIAFAGGGTGGHVVPGLHLLERLSPVGRPLGDVVWFGAGREIEARVLAGVGELLHSAPYEHVVLDLEAQVGGAPGLARLARRTWPATRVARRALRQHRSQLVLGLGGYTSLPVVLAARSLGIPVALLEVNAVMGRATRWLSPLAARVFHAWPSSLPGSSDGDGAAAVVVPAGNAKHLYTGAPIPGALQSQARDALRDPNGAAAAARGARAALGFEERKPLLVVLGGSQGARSLNSFVGDNLPALVASGLQVLHQVGPGRRLDGLPSFPGYRFSEYLDDVPRALCAATLVLCRGGASTLAEVAASSRPAFVVPYPHHPDRHQERNARCLGEGVVIVPEVQLGPTLVRELVTLAGPVGRERYLAMATALRRAVPEDATGRVARELELLLQKASGLGIGG